MIHYHGTPITPKAACAQILRGRHGLVSFADKRDIETVADVCSTFVLDNGAFTAWKSGNPIKDWSAYYEWVFQWRRHPGFDWALMPDVIDGTEEDNDELLNKWPGALKADGVPVWHMHESFHRLVRLARDYRVVAFGSSGNYARIGVTNWWVQMGRAMDSACTKGKPNCKFHGLRMLDPRIFTHLPFHSADSTNIARNIGIDSAWSKQKYAPATKTMRGLVMADRIESHQSASSWIGYNRLHEILGVPNQDLLPLENEAK
jgi:hypothetical protein